MDYAVIWDGVIVNVADSDDSCFAATQGWVALADGFGIGDLYDGAGFVKKSAEASADQVLTVTAAQFKIALSRMGKLDKVLEWVSAQNTEVQLAFSETGVFKSDSSIVAVAAAFVGVPSERVYDVFKLAALIDINDSGMYNLEVI